MWNSEKKKRKGEPRTSETTHEMKIHIIIMKFKPYQEMQEKKKRKGERRTSDTPDEMLIRLIILRFKP